MKQIHLIAEARPSFMKIASIIDALNAEETRGKFIPFSSDPYGANIATASYPSASSRRRAASPIRMSIWKSGRPQTEQAANDASTGLSTRG
jgi:hypothetical protein